ncbi:uncharacterized protein LOC143221928 isoform X2 [Lasioglossum baleicum]
MKRHVEFLIDKRINAHLLSSNTRLKEQQVIMKDLMSNRLTMKLLYATPEMTMTVYFRNLVHSLNHRKLLLYVVFNEAHCVSEQGHEYIPCYKKITSLNNVYGSVPRVAVTTAVTHEIIEDICQSLTLRSPRMFKVPVQLMNQVMDGSFVKYCLPIKCRHTVISEYFGHVADPCKVNCDVCEDRDTVVVQQIKDDICDISDDTKEEQSRSVKEKSPERAEEGAKKCSAARGEISIDENNNGAIVQYRDKQKSSSSTEGGYIQPCSSSTVKRAKDNSNATGANELVTAGSLLAKYNLNNELSLEPCGSKNNAANISIRIDGTQISSGRSNTRTRTVEKEDRVTGNDSCEVIFVGPKKRNKRYANRATCPAEFSSKRRKIETENEPTAVPRDRSGSRTSDRDERVKDDANEIVSHTESRIKGANSNIRTRMVEKEDRVTGNDSCEVIFVGPKKRNKRYANRDTCPAEFSSKRRKIGSENKPTAVPRNRSGSRTSDRDERVKDDANETVSRCYATAEYLMNKYKLDKQSITLVPCRK